MRQPEPSDLTPDQHDRTTVLRRLFAELYCFALVFRFHGRNNHLRKAVTILVVTVWVVLEVGNAYGVADLPGGFLYLRAFVGLLVGRMWNLELQQFAGLSVADSSTGQSNDPADEQD